MGRSHTQVFVSLKSGKSRSFDVNTEDLDISTFFCSGDKDVVIVAADGMEHRFKSSEVLEVDLLQEGSREVMTICSEREDNTIDKKETFREKMYDSLVGAGSWYTQVIEKAGRNTETAKKLCDILDEEHEEMLTIIHAREDN
jgi:hypothetical protein